MSSSLKAGNFKIFDKFMYGDSIDMIAQNLMALNQASMAINVENMPFEGTTLETGYYDFVVTDGAGNGSGTGANTAGAGLYDVRTEQAIPSKDITQDSYKAIKTYFHSGLYKHSPIAFSWTQQQAGIEGNKVAGQITDRLTQHQLNALIGVAVACATIDNKTFLKKVGTKKDGSGGEWPTEVNLVELCGLLFDQQQAINTLIMHPVAFNRYARGRLSEFKDAFNVDQAPIPGLRVLQSLTGQRIITTKSPQLVKSESIESTNVSTYYTIGLTDNALYLLTQGDYRAWSDINLSVRPVAATYCAETTFALKAKGYSWKGSTAASPGAAALATSSNWERKATNVEDTGIVVMQNFWGDR